MVVEFSIRRLKNGQVRLNLTHLLITLEMSNSNSIQDRIGLWLKSANSLVGLACRIERIDSTQTYLLIKSEMCTQNLKPEFPSQVRIITSFLPYA